MDSAAVSAVCIRRDPFELASDEVVDAGAVVRIRRSAVGLVNRPRVFAAFVDSVPIEGIAGAHLVKRDWIGAALIFVADGGQEERGVERMRQRPVRGGPTPL